MEYKDVKINHVKSLENSEDENSGSLLNGQVDFNNSAVLNKFHWVI